MKPRVAALAFLGVAVWAVAASLYAYRARDSAIRGWNHSLAMTAERDRLRESQLPANLDTKLRQQEYFIGSADAAFKRMLTRNAGIEENDTPRDIAFKMMDHLYQETLFSGPWLDTESAPERYLMTIYEESFNYCSSLVTMFKWALSLWDIPTRTVTLATHQFMTDPDAPTHSFAEVKIGDEFFVVDPTFNTTYYCDGEGPLNAREMVECKSGLSWRYFKKPRPGRSLEEYPDSLSDLLQRVDATRSYPVFYRYEYPEEGWLSQARARHAGTQ